MSHDVDELYEALLRGALRLYQASLGCIAITKSGRFVRISGAPDSPAEWHFNAALADASAGSLLPTLNMASPGALVVQVTNDDAGAALLAVELPHSDSHAVSEKGSDLAPLLALARSLARTFRLRAAVEHTGNQRKAEELALRDVEAFVAEAQRISRTGSWTWDPTDPQSGEWSAETYAMLGYDPAITRASFEANVARVHPDDRARYVDVVQSTAARGHDLDVEYRYLLPDGTVRHAHARGKRISPTLYIGTANDITERRAAEAAIRKAHAELAAASRLTTLGELVASLTHELNQPFAAAVGNAAAARRWLDREPSNVLRATQSIEALMEDARRAQTVIASLRAMARKSEPERRPMNIDEAAIEVAALARSELDMQGAELRLELHSSDIAVLADRVQIQQVILTLVMACLEHAGEHRPEVKLIQIQTSWIDPATLLMAIEGFAQLVLPAALDTPPSLQDAQTGGLMLALSVCRSIIEAHEGSIRIVAGRHPASRFEIELPRAVGA